MFPKDSSGRLMDSPSCALRTSRSIPSRSEPGRSTNVRDDTMCWFPKGESGSAGRNCVIVMVYTPADRSSRDPMSVISDVRAAQPAWKSLMSSFPMAPDRVVRPFTQNPQSVSSWTVRPRFPSCSMSATSSLTISRKEASTKKSYALLLRWSMNFSLSALAFPCRVRMSASMLSCTTPFSPSRRRPCSVWVFPVPVAPKHSTAPFSPSLT